MKRVFARALCAVTLVGLSTSVSAEPIYFNFTGTVYQVNGSFAPSVEEGTVVSGGFIFETDNLTRMESPDLGMVQYYDLSVSGSYAFLNVGTRDFAFPFYPQGNINNIVFHDSVCPETVFRCSALEYEDFYLSARSLDTSFDTVSSPTFIGTYRDANLGVSATDWNISDYIDWTTAGPADIASLPISSIGGYFSESTYTCDGETFCMTSGYGDFGFTIDSVTRGIGPAASVPEPGALGLFGTAAFGLLLFGRRRIARR